jgi:hypothetical protein
MPGAAPYGSQGADFDFLLARLLVFDPSRLFLGSSASHQLQQIVCMRGKKAALANVVLEKLDTATSNARKLAQ